MLACSLGHQISVVFDATISITVWVGLVLPPLCSFFPWPFCWTLLPTSSLLVALSAHFRCHLSISFVHSLPCPVESSLILPSFFPWVAPSYSPSTLPPSPLGMGAQRGSPSPGAQTHTPPPATCNLQPGKTPSNPERSRQDLVRTPSSHTPTHSTSSPTPIPLHSPPLHHPCSPLYLHLSVGICVSVASLDAF